LAPPRRKQDLSSRS